MRTIHDSSLDLLALSLLLHLFVTLHGGISASVAPQNRDISNTVKYCHKCFTKRVTFLAQFVGDNTQKQV
jgi:hypothetical protein